MPSGLTTNNWMRRHSNCTTTRNPQIRHPADSHRRVCIGPDAPTRLFPKAQVFGARLKRSRKERSRHLGVYQTDIRG
eukprot:15459903-Alexandrium_andersonii.AAC.1